MGLGKTVQTISFLATINPKVQVGRTLSSRPLPSLLSGSRLLVTGLTQTPSKRSSIKAMADYDIVVTSYNTLQQEYAKRDEFFVLRNTAQEGQLARRLEATEAVAVERPQKLACVYNEKFTIYISATRLQNRYEDIGGMIYVLGFWPLCDRDYYKKHFSDNVKGEDGFATLTPEAIEAIRFEILSTVVSAFSIRRRIHDLFDGKKILELPPLLEPQIIELRLEKKLPLN
ncbi:hypothetical protein EPUS_02154 [Endocarpon pusillum Z07020]|uniref:SNF2 N-terminal domain-containing protein n=1 Tax=Endocarpon pusillum (strain Z07020 / HMAS-L-300199) TaxID=1263415 RepID=U1G4M6_ENDPU|nr:uncharacterized protein EPUS_02154 [Endocarpon pusillum Z07020]ERF72267.1 hypothetical protein EPUS_02154 [Endocarpon pusillum Z07020]